MVTSIKAASTYHCYPVTKCSSRETIKTTIIIIFINVRDDNSRRNFESSTFFSKMCLQNEIGGLNLLLPALTTRLADYSASQKNAFMTKIVIRTDSVTLSIKRWFGPQFEIKPA